MQILLSVHNEGKGKAYRKAFLEAGAGPQEIALVWHNDPTGSVRDLDKVKGVVLCGGGSDVDPVLFGESVRYDNVEIDGPRDQLEMKLLPDAYKRRLPILCICRGIQVLNVAHKGTLYQDLLQDKFTTHQHKQTENPSVGREKETHTVTIEPDSLLARVMSTTACSVNSLHHQAVKDVGKGLRVVARSEDNVVEGIELEEDYPFLLAVEWHPEELVHRPPQLRIFERFLAACRNSGG